MAQARGTEHAATVERSGWRGPRLGIGTVVQYAVLFVLSLFFVLPLLWMVSTSLKDSVAAVTDPGWIPANPTLDNFIQILGGSGNTAVFRWLLNSTLVAVIGTLVTVLLTSLSAYAFARMDFPGKTALFTIMIVTLLLPGVMFLVPQYVLINVLGLYNTYPALILPTAAGIFGVFFMRQFFLGIPIELEEAAFVDGAGRLRTFVSVVMPLMGPAVATLSVITFLAYWNDYLWPLVVCEAEGCTLPPGLRNLQGQFVADYGLLMAGAVLAAIPVLIVYALAQRWIQQAYTSTGVKG